MNLTEATALASLQAASRGIPEKIKSARQLASEIWSEARSRGITGSLGHCKTVDEWQRRWLPSRNFRLARIPLNAAALSCNPREGNLVLKKIHAREDAPIIVDYNKNQVGKAMYGFTPQVIVIDGKHRFQAATLRGDSHIMAWVGEVAAEVSPALRAMGSGGGPAPERTTPATGSSLVAYGTSEGAERGWDSRGKGEQGATGEEGKYMNQKIPKPQRIQNKRIKAGGPGSGPKPGLGSELLERYGLKKLSDIGPALGKAMRDNDRAKGHSTVEGAGFGHFGSHHPAGHLGKHSEHHNTRNVEHHKTMRLNGTEAEGARLDKLNVKKCYAEFQAECSKGYKPRMDAVSPPGWSGTVEHMKEDHPEISNPFALSWWMKHKGYKPHQAPTK